MNLKQLEKKRAKLMKQAQGFRAVDGTFKTDADRTACEAKLAEVEAIDIEIRAIQAAPDDDEDEDVTPETREQVRAAAIAEERERMQGIRLAVRAARLEDSVAEEMITNGTRLDAARAAIIAKLAERDDRARSDGNHAVVAGEDAKDKFFRGAGNWLLHKAGMVMEVARAANPKAPDLASFDPGEFRGMTLVDLARECLDRGGLKTRGLSKMDLIGQAFLYRSTITQSTSDFAVLLENTMHKMLQAAYSTAPDTWRRWAAQSTVSDFRAHNRYRMGMFGALDSLTETGEFKNKAILDAEKATITAGTKGNIINVSRQMVINDDMSAFARLLSMLGRAAGLSVEVDMYALLLLNSGLGPTQSDAQPLFHANRANVGTGAALSAAALDGDRVVMAQQRDPWGNEYLDLRPAILLLPIGLGGQARVINDSQYDPDTVANKSQMKPNMVKGLFRDVVDTPRLTGTRRYLFADPSIAPVFEAAFLEGQTSPVLESKDGWRVDGTEMRVRLDYGVAAVDYRGAETNAGA